MALKEVIRDADSMNVLLQARLSAAFSGERQIISYVSYLTYILKQN